MSEPIKYPRREKRRQQSRASIMRAAMALFAERGFEETTLENIAQHADLHIQTLYRHFPSKSELAASIDREFLLAFQNAFGERDSDTFTFWRGWVEHAAMEQQKLGARYRKTLVNLFTVPSLSTTYLQTWYDYQQTLATGIAHDIGVSLDDSPLPMLIAAMLWGGNLYALRRWVESDGRRNLVHDAIEVVDEVVAQFGHLLTAAPADRDR